MIIGGSGELGTALTNKFKTGVKKWHVFNLDFKENKNAHKNFVLP